MAINKQTRLARGVKNMNDKTVIKVQQYRVNEILSLDAQTTLSLKAQKIGNLMTFEVRESYTIITVIKDK